jgi:hypothetical protein
MDPEDSPQTEESAETGDHEVLPPAATLFEIEEEEDEAEYFERLFAQKKAQEQEKEVQVRIALGKFNAFLHLTAYVAGVAYFILLGVLYRPALPYVFIPIALWTVGIGYHFYRAFVLGSPPKPEKGQHEDVAQGSVRDLDDDEDEEGEQP